MSEKFGKPPKKKKKPITDNDFLKEADRHGIELPKRVRFRLGDKNWNKP